MIIVKIKGKVQFTVGIADVLLSIAVSVLAVIQHQEYKLIGAVFVLLCGIIALTNGIETKKQQKKKEEKYKQMMAFLYGEDGEQDD